MAQLVKNLPAMWETWVLSLGWEDPLEKGKATHSSILAWRIPLIIKKRIKYSGLEKAFYNNNKKEQIKKESTFFKVFNPHFPKVLTYILEHKH